MLACEQPCERFARGACILRRAVAEQPVRMVATFARATRAALESVAAPPIATSLLFRAVAASGLSSVPEDIAAFRSFVDGPLRVELQRSLGAGAVTLVVGQLGHALSSARADAGAIHTAPHQSGSHPVVRRRDSLLSPPLSGHEGPISARHPTLPAPSNTTAASSRPPVATSGSDRVLRGPRSPVPMRTEDAPPDARRLRPPAVTVPAMARVSGAPLPSCVLVVSLDAALAREVATEIDGRCAVIAIATPSDLARAATRTGDRIVVLVDSTLPAIDLPTLVGLAPILPPDTRIVLWGADERTRARLASQFPATRTWVPSGDSTTPGTFALSIP